MSLLILSMATLHKNYPLLLEGWRHTGGLCCIELLDASGFLECLPNVIFFPRFAHFISCPFSIINLSHEHGYMSPASPDKLLSLVENSIGDSWHGKHAWRRPQRDHKIQASWLIIKGLRGGAGIPGCTWEIESLYLLSYGRVCKYLQWSTAG